MDDEEFEFTNLMINNFLVDTPPGAHGIYSVVSNREECFASKARAYYEMLRDVNLPPHTSLNFKVV